MPTSGRGRLNQNETNTEVFVKQMLQKQAQKHLLCVTSKPKNGHRGFWKCKANCVCPEKEKKRKDYAFRHQFDEKRSMTTGLPRYMCSAVSEQNASAQIVFHHLTGMKCGTAHAQQKLHLECAAGQSQQTAGMKSCLTSDQSSSGYRDRIRSVP